MQVPPVPPVTQQLERFLWNVKASIVHFDVRDFKGGAFHECIGWSIKLVDCLDVLLSSNHLDRAEMNIVFELASNISMITSKYSLNKTMTLTEMYKENDVVMENFDNMIWADKKSRLRHEVIKELKTQGLDSLKFEAGCKGTEE